MLPLSESSVSTPSGCNVFSYFGEKEPFLRDNRDAKHASKFRKISSTTATASDALPYSKNKTIDTINYKIKY